MAQKSRSQFKVIFSQGNVPTQQDFHDFIDSFWNCVDSVLSQNSLASSDFINAERAYSDGVLYGVNPE